jgi:hypothetical protein
MIEAMINISPNLYKRLRKILLNCGPFANSSELKAIFIDSRVSCWRDNLPDAVDSANRVNIVIDFLLRQFNANEENGLVLLLRVLSDQKGVADVCHQQLIVLSDELEQQFKAFGLASGVEPSDRIVQNTPKKARHKLQVIPPTVPRPVNMGFEGLAEYGNPSGWFNSYGFVSGVSTAYNFRVVSREDKSNEYCVRMENARASSDEFGSLMQRCLVDSYLAGRAVLLQAEVRTKHIEQWAGIWLRADDANGNDVFFDNMSNRPIKGTTNWAQYSIDAVLPPQTVWLNYGIVLVGRGTVAPQGTVVNRATAF